MSRDQKRGTWRTIKRLEKSIPQVRWYRTELVVMSLFVNIFALGLPIFILQVYDRVLPNLGLTTMQFLVVGLIAVMLLDFFLKTARAAVTTYTGARFEHLARVSAVDHILRTPQDVYENDTPGAYLDKVNAIGVVKDFYSSQLGTLMIDLPFAIFFLGMIWFLGGIMVAVPLVLLVLFGIMAIIVGGNLRRAVDTRSQVDNRRYDFLIEIINGIHTVKAQAFKNLLQRRFDPLQEMSARAVRSVAMQSSIAQSLGSTFGQLNMACVIGTGAILVIDGSLSAGELAACTLLSGRAMQPLQSAMGLWTNFQSIRVACENAVSVLELPAENMKSLPEIQPLKGELELRNVTFGYDGMDEPLINNLNLRLKAGEMVGIDGDNSSGRSTLLKLMMGLIRPNDGGVMLDGQDLSKHQSQSYRRQMAFLTADSDVYSGTILDNMTYFRGGKYISKAIKIAKQLGLDEEIKRLPEGYGTHVGDGAGGVLPAGFVQRITVIRAMIDDPKIVLFDNANHGLDSNSDKTLMEYINSLRGRTTIVLVTSRPSWLRMSDRRFMMSHGNLEPVAESEMQPRLEKPAPALPAPSDTPMADKKEEPKPQTEEKAADNSEKPSRPTAAPTSKPAQEPRESRAPQAQPARAPQAQPTRAPQAQPTRAPIATPRPKQAPVQQNNPASQQQSRPQAKQESTPAAASHRPSVASPQSKPAAQTRPQQSTPSARPAQAPQPRQQPQPAKQQAQAQTNQPAKSAASSPTPPTQHRPATPLRPTAAQGHTAEQKRPATPSQVNKPAVQSAPSRPAPKPQAAATPKPQAAAAPKPQAAATAKSQAAAAPKPQTAAAPKPQAAAAPKPQAAAAPKPQAAAAPKPQAAAAPKPQTAAAPKPQAAATPKPQQALTNSPQPAPAAKAQAPAPAASKPRPPVAPQATQQTPAQPESKATFTPSPAARKPAPKPAATLRAAPKAGNTAQPRKRTDIKPQPPKPRRVATFQPSTGGAE